jgi:zinc D-Ala-D-Ala carboxypeptidase
MFADGDICDSRIANYLRHMDWTKYPNFKASEFACKHTGRNEMKAEFMARLQRLRTAYGKPITITSGYRHPTHPEEARKPAGSIGPHTTGCAVDIPVRGHEVYALTKLAMEHGFTGIGLRQHGASRFLHLDDLPNAPGQPRPWIWTYA